MRVTANIQAAILTTTFTPGSSDRYVPLNVFAPKPVPMPSAPRQKHEEYIVDCMRMMMWQAFDPGFKLVDFQPRVPALQELKTAVALGTGAGNRRDLSNSDKSRLAGILSSLKNAVVPADIATIVNTLSADPALPRYFASRPGGARHNGMMKNVLGLPAYLPVSYPAGTSEVGYLFLDRTRCRQAGFEIGEHVDSLALGPGEETVFEVRTSRKESTSLEDTIEREFEDTLEQTGQESLTQTATEQGQTSQTGTSTQTLSPSVGVSIPVDVAKVDANLNASSSDTFTDTANNSTQNSITVAVQNSRRASSKLRQLHRVTVKSGVETGIETLSRRVIKNPNSATPITLHYFKIMQKVEMQQERTGVRLCWAPFVLDPGASLRTHIRLAKLAVFARARRNVEIPPEPVPPKKQMAPYWRESTAHVVAKTIIGRFNDDFYLSVKIGSGETYTGRAEVVKTGSAADRADITLNEDIPDRATDDGYVSVDGSVFSSDTWIEGSASVKLRVEVMRQLPGYGDQLKEYHQLLRDYHTEVARLKSVAATDAEPDAEAAAGKILAAADIRAELIAAVVRQYIDLMPGREAADIDLWSRIIDFDNVSYQLYPGWWRGGRLPYPDRSAEDFLNVELARVFLPVREGYEERFFQRLYDPSRLSGMSANAYKNLVKSFVGDLRKEQKTYRDRNGGPVWKPLGPVWTEYVPTNGTHVEAELSATTAADAVTERQIEANTAKLEADVAAITEENNIRQLAAGPVTPQIVVTGPATPQIVVSPTSP